MADAVDTSIQLAGRQDENHLINVVPDRAEALTVELAPCLTSFDLESGVFFPEYGGNAGNAKIVDAILDGGNTYPDCVWLFKGEDCCRFNVKTGNIEEGPVRIRVVWPKFPIAFASGISAAAWGGPMHSSRVYFFKGNLRTSCQIVPSEPRENWEFTDVRSLTGEPFGCWSEGPTAGLHSISTTTRAMIHYFNGREYIRYPGFNTLQSIRERPATDQTVGPVALAQYWNFPEPYNEQGIDHVFYGTGAESQEIYFIKGDQYFVYDTETSSVSTPPRPVLGRFPKLAQFIRQPQLFLVESYRMTTYYGDLSPANFSSGPQIAPGTDETYTVRVKRTSVTNITETKTVLETQDQRVVDDLNEAMKDSSSAGGSGEKYDYQMAASFDARGSVGFGSAEASGHLNVGGATNNVRTEFGKAAEKGVSKQVQKTAENRKQTIDTVNSNYTVQDEFESIWTRRITNDTDRPISLAYAQLSQQYITLVILEDVKLAFADGETSKIVELSDMDELFNEYIVDQDKKTLLKNWVVSELSEVRDYRGTKRNVLVEDSPQRVRFDPTITSTYALKNSDGSIRREIVVEGVIVSDAKFNQLTDLMVLSEVHVG